MPRNDAQKVFVMGEVNEPKLLKIDRAGMSLTEALSAVGGINQLSADATGVFVIRTSNDKSERMADVYQLNMQDALLWCSVLNLSYIPMTSCMSQRHL
ncbi:hypothetical protein VST7929_03315 [Vibrio stylophorae]|uniref:SLBB domain-containing protein n=1 Tax=Vibrio stylophorae TaxID=659351 RepID=A0ABM8ZZ41_9VIBR|nr:hypothetical protein VST7929_03315 [Vibrio stylophorae]